MPEHSIAFPENHHMRIHPLGRWVVSMCDGIRRIRENSSWSVHDRSVKAGGTHGRKGLTVQDSIEDLLFGQMQGIPGPSIRLFMLEQATAMSVGHTLQAARFPQMRRSPSRVIESWPPCYMTLPIKGLLFLRLDSHLTLCSQRFSKL